MKKDIAYYRNLPWTYTVETTQEAGELLYIVYVNELPGIATDAPTLEQAMKEIKEIMEIVFEIRLEHNEAIPEPVIFENAQKRK
jgi:predicted RNase H-like HicB family nuclease